jgi:hypothetical protein
MLALLLAEAVKLAVELDHYGPSGDPVVTYHLPDIPDDAGDGSVNAGIRRLADEHALPNRVTTLYQGLRGDTNVLLKGNAANGGDCGVAERKRLGPPCREPYAAVLK